MSQSVLQLPNQLTGPPEPLFGQWNGYGFGEHEEDEPLDLNLKLPAETKRSDRRNREHRDESNTVLDYMFNILWRTTKDFGKREVPIAWYFTANNRIRAKSRAKLIPQEILSSFLKNVGPSGIVATLMIPKFTEGKSQIVFEHLDRQGMVVISARWSPPCCHLNKIESLHKINDTRYDIYQRVPTVDGNTMNTSSRGIRGIILTQLIGKIGFNIAQHVNIAEDKIEVEKLNLYFKIDPKGIINFLFCSDIQYSNPEQAISDQQLKKIIFDRAHSEPQVVSASHRFDEEMLVVNRPRQLQKTHFCVSCSQNTNKTKIYEIKLENIAAHHNNNRLLNENRTSQAFGRQKLSDAEQTQHDGGHFPNFSDTHNGPTASQDEANGEETDRDGLRRRKLQVGNNIPPEIQTLFPNIDKDMYTKLSQNQTFLERIVTVCEDCYLFLISLRQTSGSESYKKFQLLRDDIKLKGTGRLRPDTLGIRYRDTRERIEEDVVGKFFRDQLLGEVAKGDARARRIFEAKEMLRLKGNSITQRPGTLHMRTGAQLQNKVTSPLFTQTYSSLDPLALKLPQSIANPSRLPSKYPSASHLTSQNRFQVHDSSLKLEEKTTALGSKRSESGAFNVSSPKQPTKKRLDRLFHKSFHSRLVSDELSTEKTLLGMPFYQAAKQKPANFEKPQGPGYLPQAVSAVKLIGFGEGHSVAELSALEPHEKESSVETKVVDFAQSMSAGAQSQEDPGRLWAVRPKPKKSKQRNFSITSLSSRFDMYTGGG